MDLRQLRYYVTIVEEKSISAAAKKLYVSQPPLSMQLQQLEQELGCVLLERGPRRVRMTEAGRLLYERATALLRLAEQTQLELRDYANGVRGALRFGAVSSVSGTVLPQWVSSFHAQFPDVRMELEEGNTYQLLEQLRLRQIELAIVRTPFHADWVERIPLRSEPMMAVGHARYFSAQPGQTIRLPDLTDQPLLLYRRWEQIVRKLFSDAGLHPDFFCINDDARTTAQWADIGLGVGILPASARPLLHHPEIAAYPIDAPELQSDILIVRPRDTFQSAIAARFAAHILAAAAQSAR